MKYLRRVIAAVGLVCLLGPPTVRADALLDQVQIVADAAVASNPIPVAQVCVIPQSGSYSVTLTDLQSPAALASLNLAIANSTSTAVTLSAASSPQVATLQAGSYTVQVLASAAPGAMGGSFGWQVSPAAGGAPVCQFAAPVAPVNPAPSTGQSILSSQFTVATSGAYQLTVTDLQFPVALTTLTLIVLTDCGSTPPPGCTPGTVVAPTPPLTGPGSSSITLSAGTTYDLFALGVAGGTAMQGLYSIQIASGGTSVYANTVPVGQLPAPISIPISASLAGSVSLQLTDLAAPAPLTSIRAVVTEGASVLGQLSSAATASLAPSEGTMQLFVLAQPGGSSGQGAYEAYATAGSVVVADIAQPVLSPGSSGYAFSTTLAASGNYEAGIFDFKLPTAFSSLSEVVAQAGVVLATTQNSSGIFAAAAGPVNVVVFPTLSSPTATGLFGAQLVLANGPTVLSATQGVGGLFSSQSFTVTSAGSYDLTLTDLGFPAKFSGVTMIATQGYSSLAAQKSTAGTLTFDAQPGTYVLNVFAQTGSGVDYGMYGVNVFPSPTVTLTANSNSVASGAAATLTWNSSNTTSCSASASPSATGWTGVLGTSGTQTTGALSATTTFSISCTGQSGTSTNATVSVAVSPPSKGGGGGTFSEEILFLLALAMIPKVARRRAN